MLYGCVPYNATTVAELLSQILDRGPQFARKRISKRLESLIRGLLEHNPALRMSHEALFDAVIRDTRFPNSLMDSLEASELSSSSRFRRPLEQSDEATINGFVRELLFERAKYRYLVEVATKTAGFKK
jgi:serine/threonine protein kinase